MCHLTVCKIECGVCVGLTLYEYIEKRGELTTRRQEVSGKFANPGFSRPRLLTVDGWSAGLTLNLTLIEYSKN